MQVSVKSVELISSIRCKMQIIVSAADVNKELDKRLKKMRADVSLPGFRPRKVPLSIVRDRYGLSVMQDISSDFFASALTQAAQQEKLRIAGDTKILEDTNVTPEGGIVYHVSFEIYPEIKLVSQENLTITRPIVKMGENYIDNVINNIRNQQKSQEEVNRPVRNNDIVNIDFIGKIDEKDFPGNLAQNSDLTLGQGQMLPDFENGVIGMSVGESKTIDVNFPENYQAQELQGKTAQFSVKIHQVHQINLPEIDAEFIKKAGTEDGTMASFKEDLIRNIQNEVDSATYLNLKYQVMQNLQKSHEFEIPTSLISQEEMRMRQTMQQQNPNEKKLSDEFFTSAAAGGVKLGLIVGQIILENNIQVSDEQRESKLHSLAKFQPNPDNYIHSYKTNADAMKTFDATIIEDMVTNRLLKQVNTTDEEMTFDVLLQKNNAISMV